MALLGACDVIQDGGQDSCHLGFYPILEIITTTTKNFHGSQVECDKLKRFAAICLIFYTLALKKKATACVFVKTGMTTRYL